MARSPGRSSFSPSLVGLKAWSSRGKLLNMKAQSSTEESDPSEERAVFMWKLHILHSEAVGQGKGLGLENQWKIPACLTSRGLERTDDQVCPVAL